MKAQLCPTKNEDERKLEDERQKGSVRCIIVIMAWWDKVYYYLVDH